MALIDKHFKEKGFSKQTRKLLQASWRKGTQKDYSCKFRKCLILADVEDL
jgi:hypothetical protein